MTGRPATGPGRAARARECPAQDLAHSAKAPLLPLARRSARQRQSTYCRPARHKEAGNLPSPGDSRSRPDSTAPASWTAPSSTHSPSTSAALPSRLKHRLPEPPPAVRGPAHRRMPVTGLVRLCAGGDARTARLPIFEATSANIGDLGEEHGHRVLRVCGKGTKVVLVPLPPAISRAIDWAIGSPMRGADPAQQPRRPDGPARGRPPLHHSPEPPTSRSPGHTPACSATRLSRLCSTLALTCAMCRSPPGTPIPYDHPLRPGPPEPRPARNYILAASMASGT
jgi:hypothetical protein